MMGQPAVPQEMPSHRAQSPSPATAASAARRFLHLSIIADDGPRPSHSLHATTNPRQNLVAPVISP